MVISEASSHSLHCPHILPILQQISLYPHSILIHCHPYILMQTLVLEVELPTHSLLSAQNFNTLLLSAFSPQTPKAPVMQGLALSPIHPFIYPRMHSLYPFPTLSRILSMLFQNLSLSLLSPSLRPYPTTTQTLTFENLNLIHRILELTHQTSITALCSITVATHKCGISSRSGVHPPGYTQCIPPHKPPPLIHILHPAHSPT